MRVLLTGGSGNLGQALVPKLLDNGDTPRRKHKTAAEVMTATASF